MQATPTRAAGRARAHPPRATMTAAARRRASAAVSATPLTAASDDPEPGTASGGANVVAIDPASCRSRLAIWSNRP